MESTHPHRFTLGDFFSVWGVALGPDRVGGLTGLGGDQLQQGRHRAQVLQRPVRQTHEELPGAEVAHVRSPSTTSARNGTPPRRTSGSRGR
jgi:hypothetical protein